MTRLLIVVWKPEDWYNTPRLKKEEEKINYALKSMGFEALDLDDIDFRIFNTKPILTKLMYARKENKRYYIIIPEGGAPRLHKAVRDMADNVIRIINGNFVELNNFERHPEIIWGRLNGS